jgi:hypothetical protein
MATFRYILHNHSFFNIIFDMTFNLHHAHLRSCVNLGANVWLFVCLVIPPFYLPSNVFSFVLHTKLGLSHSLAFGAIHCICGQPLDPTGTHLLCFSHGGEWIASHDAIRDAFASIVRDARFRVSYEQTHVLPPPSL